MRRDLHQGCQMVMLRMRLKQMLVGPNDSTDPWNNRDDQLEYQLLVAHAHTRRRMYFNQPVRRVQQLWFDRYWKMLNFRPLPRV